MTQPSNHPDERRCTWHPDRLTMLQCGRCERPMCIECAVETPVGMRCRECAGVPTGARAVAQRMTPKRANVVTMALIVINIALFVIQEATRNPGSELSGGLSGWGWIYGPSVADGEWYRIVTGAFLHGSILHVVLNMFVLWQLGTVLETSIGSLRFGLIYAVSIVWGSAGALIASPLSPTVGASGGVFGLFAALLLLQWRLQGTVAPELGLWLVLNLVITFAVPGISIGGHLGGIAGGAVAVLALMATGRQSIRASRVPAVAIGLTVGLVIVGYVVGIVAASSDGFGTASAMMGIAHLIA